MNNNIDVCVILKEIRECSVMCLLSHRYVRMRVERRSGVGAESWNGGQSSED